VGGQTFISAAGQSVTLDSASNFGGTVSITAASASINDVNGLDLGTFTVSGDLAVSAGGAVTDSGVLSVGAQTRISAAGQSVVLNQAHAFGAELQISGARIELSRSDSLRLPQGSVLQAPGGSIELRAGSDVWTSGLTLSAPSVLIDAGHAIKAEDLKNAQPLVIDGALRLQAQAGIGSFGGGRVLLEQLGSAASVSASNVDGDVVIAGQTGLTLSAQSVVSDTDDWVVLLGGRGAIEEQGQLIVRPNLIRATGITWMDRSQIETLLMINAALKSGALLDQVSSPLERMNQLLAQSWGAETAPQDALDRSAPVLTTNARSTVQVGPSRQAPVASISVMAQPKSSAQLMDMAMTLTRQGSNPLPGDAESISGWVVRTAPPAADAGRDAPPTRSEPVPNAAPPQQAPAVETRPAPSTESDKPAEPPKAAPDAPAAVPNSGVRWLLPEEELQGLMPGANVPSTPPETAGGLISGLKGAALKLSQWLGWSEAAAPAQQAPTSAPDAGSDQA
jgi:hypothetical protein